jgi:signal transduction histidine kinase
MGKLNRRTALLQKGFCFVPDKDDPQISGGRPVMWPRPVVKRKGRPVHDQDELEARRGHGALDELTALAAAVFDVPLCTVSLAGREEFAGWNHAESPRATSFSGHMIGGHPLVVPGSLIHPVFPGDGIGRFVAGAPIVDADGQVLGALCLFDDRPRDFSGSRLGILDALGRQAAFHLGAARERRELARIKQREEDFVATVSHEMRTPITVMQGYLETLAEDEDLTAYRRMIDPIRRNGERLVRMVDHLLAGTEPAGPPVTLEPGRLDLDCVARAAIAGCEQPASDAGVRLRLAEDSASVPVRGDFGALCRALEQLVHNAIAFSDKGGEVVVRVVGTGGPAIEVVDRGAGIPADELPHVTERFYRGRHARDNAVAGVGLGLTIATRIAASHGGALTISSAGPGAGTSVRLNLPVPRPQGDRRALARAGRRVSSGPRNRPGR